MLPLPAPASSVYAPVRTRDGPDREFVAKGKGGRKGKGKSEAGAQGSSVAPRGVKGAVGRDAKGRANCFNYILSECSEAPAGGEDLPRPLRTLDEPDGISSLKGTDLLRVSAANILYAFVVEVMEPCCSLEILCMVENSRNSLFWFVTVWDEMECLRKLYFQDHQACAYGSKRPKCTRLCANFEQVHTISGTCDGQHEHEPWGLVKSGNKRVFATSLEVHCPPKLCETNVHAFILCLLQLGLSPDSAVSKLQHNAKASTGLQAISAKLPPLIPTFQHRYVLFFLQNSPVWPAECVAPPHHKLLHDVKFGGDIGVESRENYKQRLLDELMAWHVDFSWESFQQVSLKFDEMKFLEYRGNLKSSLRSTI
eukprot:s2204_g5.t2